LLNMGLIKEAVGVDYSENLIVDARNKAAELPLRYYVIDTNTAVFPETGYDLVVNHAAAHHIAYINKVFSENFRATAGRWLFYIRWITLARTETNIRGNNGTQPVH